MGTAMGTRAALNFANVSMDRFEDTIVYQAERSHYVIIDWVMFIDDIFLIWKEDGSSPATFRKYLKGVEPSTRFTHEISYKSVNFLDTKVIDVQGYISTDTIQKPTDTHPYLHWTSAHPPHLKESIPYSQALKENGSLGVLVYMEA